jgi:hypothetical protein
LLWPFQIGIRAENLEWHLEKYFGPKGLVKTHGVKIMDKVGDDVEAAVKKAKEAAGRPKRSVSKDQTLAATSKVSKFTVWERYILGGKKVW